MHTHTHTHTHAPQSGSAAHMLWVRVCRRGDRAVAPWLAYPALHGVPWGWGEAAWGGASSRCCDGYLELGAHSLPAARPWGRQPRPIAYDSWAREVRLWQPGSNPTAHAVASCRCALWGWHEDNAVGMPRAFLRGVWSWELTMAATTLGQAVGVRCPRAVGAIVQTWEPGIHALACMSCWALHATGAVGGCPGGLVSPL